MFELVGIFAKLGIVVALVIVALPYITKQDDPHVRNVFGIIAVVAIIVLTLIADSATQMAANWFCYHRDIAWMLAAVVVGASVTFSWVWISGSFNVGKERKRSIL